MRHAVAFATTLLTFLFVDLAWLSLVAGDFFKSEVGALLLPMPNLAAAAAFYLIYAIALAVLVVEPAIRLRSLTSAISKGVLFGFAAYATFDLTNLSIVAGWTLMVSVVDMAWGTFCSGLAAAAGYCAGVSISGPSLSKRAAQVET